MRFDTIQVLFEVRVHLRIWRESDSCPRVQRIVTAGRWAQHRSVRSPDENRLLRRVSVSRTRSEVPIAVACWIGVGFATISGVLWTDSGIDALEVANEELKDQRSNLDSALDKCASASTSTSHST